MANQTELDEQIRQALTEIRMVLPGAQALLGFQFIAMVLQEFEKIPGVLKELHLVSLGLMAIAVIMLMTPAACHRIVYEGENTQAFHDFASRMLLVSLVPLALGVAGDFFIVIAKVFESYAVAGLVTGVLLILNFGFWFVWPVYKRRSGKQAAH